MATILGLLPTIISLFFAAAGIIFLFWGSFSQNQFEDAMILKIVVFTIFALLFSAFMFNARKCNSLLENACHKHMLMKPLVQSLFLGFASMVNFLIKYPRFNVHSPIDDSQRNKLSSKCQFNLYSMGSFSAFAIVISSKRQEAMEIGVSDFLFGLTMDASMEIPGMRGPNLWYMLGAYVYCTTAIFIKSYLVSLKVDKSISLRTHGNIHDLETVMVIGGASKEETTQKSGTLGGFGPTTEICGETAPFVSENTSFFVEESESNIPRDTPSLKEKLVDIANGGNAVLTLKKLRVVNLADVGNNFPYSLRYERLIDRRHRVQDQSSMISTDNVGDSMRVDTTETISIPVQHFLPGFTYSPSPSQAANSRFLVEINLKLSLFLRLFGDIPISGGRLVSEIFEDYRRSSENNVVEHDDGAVEQGRVTIEALLKKDIRQIDGLRRRKNNISANLEMGNMLPELQTVRVYNDNFKELMTKLE